MQYSRLIWHHSFPSEPVQILSEYDATGFELRKVEIFADGSLGYASETESVGGCQLSLITRPPDIDVQCEPEMRVTELSQAEFESTWRLAHSLKAAV